MRSGHGARSGLTPAPGPAVRHQARALALPALLSTATDLHLLSAVPNRTEPEYLIWANDSSGVYVLYDLEAFFISANSPFTITPATMVPAFSTPTHGGACLRVGEAGRPHPAGPWNALEVDAVTCSCEATRRDGPAGAVSDMGWEESSTFRANTATLHVAYVPGWVAYRDMGLIPFGTQNYTTSDAFDWY